MVTTIFGQLVVGPPGSGKSTYCKYICENLKQIERNAKIINLDPANDCLPYKPSIDIMEIINVQKVMEQTKYGPNGSMIYCLETLNDCFGWLYDKIVTLINDEMTRSDKEKSKDGEASGVQENKLKPYLLFDCPGQSELYIHHTSVKDIVKKLTTKGKHFDLRLTCVNLCDAYHASDLGKYIGMVMNSLSTMVNLELPHVNILSKVDKIEAYGKTRFNLDFYCELSNLKYLLETELESPFHKKYRKLAESIIGVIDDYSLVFFIPLNIQQVEDIRNVLLTIDKANGYSIDDLDLSILQFNPRLLELASGKKIETFDYISSV